MDSEDKEYSFHSFAFCTTFLAMEIHFQNTNRSFEEMQEMRENGQPYSDRVDYIYDLMEECDLFPDVAKLKEDKCDKKSEAFRQDGNVSFKCSQYVQAIKMYNKSICYAATQENISIAIANRSAAFFKMKMFSECLESIQLARKVGLPVRLTEKLAEREVKCKEEMQKVPEAEICVPKIGMPVNEKIPFLAKCLALREDETFGKHIVTEEDIPAGTIIAIEEPYCTIPDKYLRCATCLAEVPHLLLPCDACTQIMFCSRRCQEEAFKDFHAIECPISGALFKIFGDDYRLVLRMAISAFFAFPDVDTMATALEKIELEQKNVFSFDWSQELTREERYTSIHNLKTNEEHRNERYQFENYVMTCLIFRILQRSSSMFGERFLTSDKAEVILKNLICRHLMIIKTNAQKIEDVRDKMDFGDYDLTIMEEKDDRGHCISPFISLIGHSCAHNCITFPLRQAMAVVTCKNISAGNQIFANYGYNFHIMDKATRQKNIMERFCFNCKCVACVEDFPLLCSIPEAENVPYLPFQSFSDAWHSCRLAEEGFKAARNYIREYGHLFPIRQLLIAEDQLMTRFHILYGNYPLNSLENIPPNAFV